MWTLSDPYAQALVASLLLALTLTLGYAAVYSGRLRLYDRLAARQAQIAAGSAIAPPALKPRTDAPSFDDRLTQLFDVLETEAFDAVKLELDALTKTERSYLPTHKKGGTVAYETLIEKAPLAVQLYQSQAMLDLVSRIVGARVRPTPLNDQSSLSLLVYEKPGDHIEWHYDHNFYRGRHFTVLLAIVNRGIEPGTLSATRFQAKRGDHVREFATPPNALLIFEGAKVLHKATPLQAGERRMVLSMTYCTDPRARLWQGVARRIKDTAFFGPRALWT